MDKETLSNYGWIVVCVVILAIMIALASPFGNYIKTGIKSVVDGFNGRLDGSYKQTGTFNAG